MGWLAGKPFILGTGFFPLELSSIYEVRALGSEQMHTRQTDQTQGSWKVTLRSQDENPWRPSGVSWLWVWKLPPFPRGFCGD